MLETVLGILLLVMAVILVVCVLCQEGKDKRLSGTIAGGADNFFGQGKGSKKDKLLPKITTIVSIIFIVVVVVMYVITLNTPTTQAPTTSDAGQEETDSKVEYVEDLENEDVLDSGEVAESEEIAE